MKKFLSRCLFVMFCFLLFAGISVAETKQSALFQGEGVVQAMERLHCNLSFAPQVIKKSGLSGRNLRKLPIGTQLELSNAACKSLQALASTASKHESTRSSLSKEQRDNNFHVRDFIEKNFPKDKVLPTEKKSDSAPQVPLQLSQENSQRSHQQNHAVASIHKTESYCALLALFALSFGIFWFRRRISPRLIPKPKKITFGEHKIMFDPVRFEVIRGTFVWYFKCPQCGAGIVGFDCDHHLEFEHNNLLVTETYTEITV